MSDKTYEQRILRGEAFEGEQFLLNLNNFPLSKEESKLVGNYELGETPKRDTFKQYFFGKHGFWPAKNGEDFTTVQNRLFNTLSDYLEDQFENVKIQLG